MKHTVIVKIGGNPRRDPTNYKAENVAYCSLVREHAVVVQELEEGSAATQSSTPPREVDGEAPQPYNSTSNHEDIQQLIGEAVIEKGWWGMKF